MPTDKKRINLSIPEEVYERLTKYKKKNGITSDAGACLQLIVRQLDAIDNTEVMLDIVRKFSVEELNQISEQGMSQLKGFADSGILPK